MKRRLANLRYPRLGFGGQERPTGQGVLGLGEDGHSTEEFR
jgi:hypothetical protein